MSSTPPTAVESPFESPQGDLTPPPTKARYIVLGFLCSLSVVLYLDRNCINQAASSIKEEFGISNTAMGWIFNAFTVSYVLFEVPTGHWGDRYGSRGVLTRIVAWWSVFTALTGAVSGFWSLLAVRFLFGAGEAGALPNTSRVLNRWFPAASRDRIRGIVITSANVGGILAPTLAAYTIRYLDSWRLTFALFGVVGIVWAAIFYWWFRDDPAQHPSVNEAERQLIAPQASTSHDEHPPVPWGLVLTSANVWLMGGIMSCAAFFSYMYMMWYATYLQEARGVDKIESGWLSSLVMFGAGCGGVVGGFLAERVISWTGNRRNARRWMGMFAFSSAAFFVLCSTRVDSAQLSALCMATAAMCGFMQLPNWWAVVAEISGRHSGALFGLMNSMGGPGPFVSQLFFGWMADRQKALGFSGRAQWDPAFNAYIYVLLLGAVLWWFVDASKSAVTADRKPEERL